MAGLLLTLVIQFLYNLLLGNSPYGEKLIAYSCVYGFLYGPLLFFYVKSYLNKEYRLIHSKELVHFFVPVTLLFLPFFDVYLCGYARIPVSITMTLYCFLCLREIIRYKSLIKHVSSNALRQEVKWVTVMVFLMLFLIVLDALQIYSNRLEVFGISFDAGLLAQLGVLFLVSIIIYQGLQKPSNFQQLTEAEIEVVKTILDDSKPKKVEKVILELSEKIAEHMKDNKPFLDPDLTLNGLSSALDETPALVSESINKVFQTNFSNYINEFRIETAVKFLEDKSKKNMTIKEIMYDSGFNSRSVFNTAFKSKVGFTPSEYRNKTLE